jgi:Cys-tRNA synthase (O-phospho-L-seryl-tRNA:Cys-tRNA synthase)
MKLEIEIDEKHIAELVTQEIARRIVMERGYENREARFGIRDGVDKAIKQYIYSKKDEVIERVVNRASVEIVKKGLPKLIERNFFDCEGGNGRGVG